MRVIVDNASGGREVSLKRQKLISADVWVTSLSLVPQGATEIFVNHAEVSMSGDEIKDFRKKNPEVLIFVYHPDSRMYGRLGIFDAGLDLSRIKEGDNPHDKMWVIEGIKWPAPHRVLAEQKLVNSYKRIDELKKSILLYEKEIAAIKEEYKL